MSNTTVNRTNTSEHIKNRELDKERHQRLAEAMDEAVKVLEEAAEAVKQGLWDEKLGAVLTALESKEKPSIPFALGSLGLETVPEALMNLEHKEGFELFRSLLAQGIEGNYVQHETTDQTSPRKQRTRSAVEVTATNSRYHVDYEKILFPRLQQVLSALNKDKISFPFRKPVTLAEAPNYYEIITNPMDLSTMRKKLEQGVYKSPEEFWQDLLLICDNAFHYNAKNSEVYELAKELKKRSKKLMEPIFEQWSSIVQILDESEGKGNNEASVSQNRESGVVLEPSYRKTRKRSNVNNREPNTSKTADIKSSAVETEEDKAPRNSVTAISRAGHDKEETETNANVLQESNSLSTPQTETKEESKDLDSTEATSRVAKKELANEVNNRVEESSGAIENVNTTSSSQPKRKSAGKSDAAENKSRNNSNRNRKRSRARR